MHAAVVNGICEKNACGYKIKLLILQIELKFIPMGRR